MSSVFIKLSPGGGVNYKDSVNTAGDLPTVGNTIGDVRTTRDTGELYIWQGGPSWTLISGGGGGSPGGVSGAVQFNNSGSFNGDSQFKWDDTNNYIDLNGLAIKALSSSTSLVDNQSSPVTAFSYSASSYKYSIIEYSISRNGEEQVGTLYVANNTTSSSLTNTFANTVDLGISFSSTISSGDILIQYTTTNTGFNGFMRYSIRQWTN